MAIRAIDPTQQVNVRFESLLSKMDKHTEMLIELREMMKALLRMRGIEHPKPDFEVLAPNLCHKSEQSEIEPEMFDEILVKEKCGSKKYVAAISEFVKMDEIGVDSGFLSQNRCHRFDVEHEHPTDEEESTEVVHVLVEEAVFYQAPNMLDEMLELSLDEMKEKTDSFQSKTLIGDGSYGRLHVAQLNDGTDNKLDVSLELDSNVNFLTQVSMVSILKHENLVGLRGHCVDGNIRVLACEYAMTSLHDILHGPVFDWIRCSNERTYGGVSLNHKHGLLCIPFDSGGDESDHKPRLLLCTLFDPGGGVIQFLSVLEFYCSRYGDLHLVTCLVTACLSLDFCFGLVIILEFNYVVYSALLVIGSNMLKLTAKRGYQGACRNKGSVSVILDSSSSCVHPDDDLNWKSGGLNELKRDEFSGKYDDVDDARGAADSKEYSALTREYLSCGTPNHFSFNLIEYLLCNSREDENTGVVLVSMTIGDEMASLKDKLQAHHVLEYTSWVLLLACHGCRGSKKHEVISYKPEDGIQKIILATNIAETTTIEDEVFLIYYGKAKEASHNALGNTTFLLPSSISKVSAKQQRGRAGHVHPRECYHLYSRCVYDAFIDYHLSEILSTLLQSCCLQIKSMKLDSTFEFLSKALQSPEYLVVQNVIHLKIIRALDESENSIILGQYWTRFPKDPKLGKMLFLFMVGMSFAFVYMHIPFKVAVSKKKRALDRAAKLLTLRISLQGGGYFPGVNHLTIGVDMEQIRWMGVLPRIAATYWLAAVCKIRLRNNENANFGSSLLKKYQRHGVAVFIFTTLYPLLYGLYVPDWEYQTPNEAYNGGKKVLRLKGEAEPFSISPFDASSM